MSRELLNLDVHATFANFPSIPVNILERDGETEFSVAGSFVLTHDHNRSALSLYTQTGMEDLRSNDECLELVRQMLTNLRALERIELTETFGLTEEDSQIQQMTMFENAMNDVAASYRRLVASSEYSDSGLEFNFTSARGFQIASCNFNVENGEFVITGSTQTLVATSATTAVTMVRLILDTFYA